ncbi:MAG: hypothetical protein ACFCUI_11860 [Bernardetiaceae bacterium]
MSRVFFHLALVMQVAALWFLLAHDLTAHDHEKPATPLPSNVLELDLGAGHLAYFRPSSPVSFQGTQAAVEQLPVLPVAFYFLCVPALDLAIAPYALSVHTYTSSDHLRRVPWHAPPLA